MAGLFFLLDASYVGAFQIAAYIGAVVVLILFTVMLVGRPTGEPPLELKRLSLLAAILLSLLMGTAAAVSRSSAFTGPHNCGSGCDLVALSCTLHRHIGVQ